MTEAAIGTPSERAEALEALYVEIWETTRERDPQLVRRELHPAILDSEVFLIAQALAKSTQRLSGYPYCYPGSPSRLSRGGLELDRFLNQFGYSIDPEDRNHRYAYHSDIGHHFPGRRKKGSGDVLPSPSAITTGRRWLAREIELIDPTVVITLGKPATVEILKTYAGTEVKSLADALGHRFDLALGNRSIPIFAAHHPSGAFQHPSSKANYEWVATEIRRLLDT